MNEFWKAAVQIGFWRTIWLRIGYRPWSRMLHAVDLHYAPRGGPDGQTAWCQWCGLRARISNLPPIPKGSIGNRAPGSAQTPPDTPAGAAEGHSQSSPAASI